MSMHWVADERAMKMLSYMRFLEERLLIYAQDSTEDLVAARTLLANVLEENTNKLINMRSACRELEEIGNEFYKDAEKQLLVEEKAAEPAGEE